MTAATYLPAGLPVPAAAVDGLDTEYWEATKRHELVVHRVVVIVDLEDGAPAASVGFQKGDIILSVNSQKIAKTGDLDKAAKTSSRLWRIVVVRGGQQINVTLGG